MELDKIQSIGHLFLHRVRRFPEAALKSFVQYLKDTCGGHTQLEDDFLRS